MTIPDAVLACQLLESTNFDFWKVTKFYYLARRERWQTEQFQYFESVTNSPDMCLKY